MQTRRDLPFRKPPSVPFTNLPDPRTGTSLRAGTFAHSHARLPIVAMLPTSLSRYPSHPHPIQTHVMLSAGMNADAEWRTEDMRHQSHEANPGLLSGVRGRLNFLTHTGVPGVKGRKARSIS